MNAAAEFHDTNQVPMNLNKWNVKQLGLRLWRITVIGILVLFFISLVDIWQFSLRKLYWRWRTQKRNNALTIPFFLFFIIILLVWLLTILHEGNFSRGIVPCNLYESLQNRGEPSHYCMPTIYIFSQFTLLSFFRRSTILAMTSRLFLLFLLVLTSNDPINILIGPIPFPQNHKPNQKLRATSIRKLVLHTWNYTTPI